MSKADYSVPQDGVFEAKNTVIPDAGILNRNSPSIITPPSCHHARVRYRHIHNCAFDSEGWRVTIYTRFSLSSVFNHTTAWWFLEYYFKYQSCKTIHFSFKLFEFSLSSVFTTSPEAVFTTRVPCVTDILRFEDRLCILRKSGTGLMTPSGHHGSRHREDHGDNSFVSINPENHI